MSRILIVEDDPSVMRGLKDNLTFESYDVITASSAERAYRLIHDERPDLVLMDVMLPGMCGSELCRLVRAEGVTTPIVMLTAKTQESDRVLGLDGGADDYVSKPFGIRELSARIRSLLRNRRQANAEHGRLVDELQSAADVQRSLFPRTRPALRTLDCAGLCRPASAVGGDYFDYVPIGGGRVALVLADVAGKGMPAALLMASLHGAIRAQAAARGDDLEQLLTTINALLYQDDGRPSYATLFYGVYDDETQILDYVNAGHPAPLLVRKVAPGFLGSPKRRMREGGSPADAALKGCATHWLQPTCTPVGMFETVEAGPQRIQLHAFDALVVHSDGVTDATSATGEEFGRTRLVDLVSRSGDHTAAGLCDAVFEAVVNHQLGVRPHDDITVLTARVGAFAS